MTYTTLDNANREEWLEQRRTGITATDIARLHYGGPAAWEAVRAEKEGHDGDFHGNRFTEWGKARESEIMGLVSFGFDVEPNDKLCVYGGDEPWLATPDGLGAGRNAEVKTTVKDWEPTIDGIPKKYLAQVDWSQLVTGATETVFAWEPHENFVPGQIRTMIIERNEDRIAELVETAHRFLAFMTEDRTPGEFDDLIAAYVVQDAVVKEATAELDAIKQQIKDRAGDRAVSAKSPFGSISYATPKPRVAFDSTGFRKDHPEIAAEYMKESPASAPVLRVTVK
ncbi:YqaJ viral recombinase family protein [Mycetocola saprophilus]|uniref:YqaJ viral recombinase family protein n=1 Tax=Mycetocola saprophilus TaxID=76636 RepID=UPI0006924854|nr:YqaJ viral recombinase family protein [Mycetocola saprophilus]